MKTKKRFWKTVLLISLLSIVFALGAVVRYLYQGYASQKRYEDLKETVERTAEDSVSLEEIENSEFTGEREGKEAKIPEDIFADMDNPIDFSELQKINQDLYAWIRIPDTKIDYPVAQRVGDDSYYLHHDMYNEPRFAGCIYSEEANKKDFTDPNTILYGHNMLNGSMFQNLHLFREKTFFEEHPYLYIYTPDETLVYKVFAAYTYDDRHILNSFDFSDEQVYAQYIEDIFHVRSMDVNLREDIFLTTDDKILTLETCIGNQTNARYLVQAVLAKRETIKK